jgi:transglutaminase superfamily protein
MPADQYDTTPPSPDVLNFYRGNGPMTSDPTHAPLINALPDDIPGMARAMHGLLLHQHIAPAYGQKLPEQRLAEPHLRSVRDMLDALLAHDDRALTASRPPEKRLVGVCRHFTTLFVTALRAKGYAARARCGFGAYFEKGRFIDHWVCEYWNVAQARWMLVDAQIDELQRGLFKPDFDLLDIPRDRFVIAGEAWRECRKGRQDPSKFGIMQMTGLWFIAGNVLRDFAALNNVEMLPWDVWGPMFRPGESASADQLALFDRLAALTRSPDTSFAELRELYEHGPGLKVPPTVFNAVLNRPEAVAV